jgi:hypothetical protein
MASEIKIQKDINKEKEEYLRITQGKVLNPLIALFFASSPPLAPPHAFIRRQKPWSYTKPHIHIRRKGFVIHTLRSAQ